MNILRKRVIKTDGYIIKKAGPEALSIDSPEWSRAEIIGINTLNWKEFDAGIHTEARVLYNEKGLFVKFVSDEHPVSVNCREFNGEVYEDSAVEFFFAPDNGSENYFNFEINAEGYALIGLGPGRERIRIYDTDPSLFDIQTTITDKGFEVFLFIPFTFIKKYFDNISGTMKGNFQKCRETPPLTHFYSAFGIGTPEPDFHRPEYFKSLVFE